jgi:outer membrane protein assembly factor BamA
MPKLFHLLGAAIAMVAAQPTWAETPDDEIETIVDQVELSSRATNRIIVPVPLAGPQLGAGLGLGAVWFYSPSASSRPWTTGFAGLATTNGSVGIGGQHSMSLSRDRIRVDVTAAYGNFNTQYFGVGGEAGQDNKPVPITQTPILFQGQATMRMIPNLYVGGRLRFLDMTTVVRSGPVIPPDIDIKDIEEQDRVVAVGPVVNMDLTDGSLNPRSGTTVNGQWLFAVPGLGSDNAYSKANLTINHYVDVNEKTVVAFRGSLCAASAGTPFFDLCLYGSSSNLRGYSTGQYRDRASWTVQTEWRRHVRGKFGVVAFAGIGGIAPGLGAIGNSTLLPAAGGGIRYEVSSEYRVNVRLDAAVGRDSSAIHVALGEAF